MLGRGGGWASLRGKEGAGPLAGGRKGQNLLPPGSERPFQGLADAPKAWEHATQTGARSPGLFLTHAPGPPLTSTTAKRGCPVPPLCSGGLVSQ